MSDAARELAGKIVASATGKATLSVANASSLSATEVADARRALEGEIQRRGLRLVERTQGALKIDVTLSENLWNYVWVAEIRSDDKLEVVMIVRMRPQAAGRTTPETSVALERKLLLEQEEPILDLALIDGELLVLGATDLALYRRQDEHWELHQSAPVASARARPRDLRGRLALQGDSFWAYLPGILCTGMRRPALIMECREEDVQWPLAFGAAELVSGRNFFVKEKLPPFFSVAGVEEQRERLWVLAGLDGRAHLYNKAFEPAGMFAGWGSDVAGIGTRCGSGRQLLATKASNSTELDSVQAFEILNRQPVVVSAPVEFPGPVTALWPLAAGDGAVVVARTLRTGRYAAFHLSISCDR